MKTHEVKASHYETKMKKLLIIFCLLMTYTFVNGQDMSGEWNGVLKQEVGGAASDYYFQLNLIQKGEKISGTSKVYFIDKPQFYAVMRLKGTFKNDILLLEEIRIIDKKGYKGMKWCIKKAKLHFTFKKDGFCIAGTWSGSSTKDVVCVPGTIKMCKIVPIASL
jgi:hypothetical protein